MANAPTTAEMVAHVKQYALDHYEQGGWDYIVECYTDQELAAMLAGSNASTLTGAVRVIARQTGIHLRAEVRADIQGA